jgi:D-alanine-D-alanine ligase
VKPIAEGTGKGVNRLSRVNDAGKLGESCGRLLATYAQPVLVEEYLPGREFTTAVLGTGRQARVLGTMEVCILAGAPDPDYSFEVKEKCEQFARYPPMEPGALRDEVERMALAAHRALECRDASRVDVRLDAAGRPAFMEINPLPGLHPAHSDLPMIATQEGMSYSSLIRTILDSAAVRCPLGS